MNVHNDTRPIKVIDEENLNSRKVFIQYPIPKICNFRCEYCFHQDFFNEVPNVAKYANDRGFTLEQFHKWMGTHIYPNFDTVVIHFAGGDPFFSTNADLVFNLMNQTNAKFDFLTNGLSLSKAFHFELLERFRPKINRIGFTFHRLTITNPKQIEIFNKNLFRLRNMGIRVYVKELLFKDHILDILSNRRFYESEGIEFKISDYQNQDATPVGYNVQDLALIDDEYKHQGHYCSCWQGYRSISIRGYDIAAGEVVACWLDPKIIGNVANNT